MALSIEQTGKYTSENHELAKQSGKLTAGEAAKSLNEQHPGLKVTAAELRPFAIEWHHSGFYKATGGRSTMGKTWFFDESEIERLYAKVIAAREHQAVVEAEQPVTVYYFEAGFTQILAKYGKKRWQPVADFDSVEIKPSDVSSFMRKRTQITEQDYEQCKGLKGCYLEPYETFDNFKKRML